MKKHKNDILLVLCLLLLACAFWGVAALTKKQGGEAVISVDGETIARLPLDKNCVYPVKTSDAGVNANGNENVIEVLDGRVRVREADCPNQLCVRQGWINASGEIIVCLPHKLIVAIEGGINSEVDASTF